MREPRDGRVEKIELGVSGERHEESKGRATASVARSAARFREEPVVVISGALRRCE